MIIFCMKEILMLCVSYIDPIRRSYMPYILIYMSNTHGIYSLQVTDKQRYSTRLFALSNATLIFGQIFSFPSNS